MYRTSWIQSSIFIFVLGLSAALAAPASAYPLDAWITAKTKLALLTTEGVGGTAVSVDTIVGLVTLHGQVRSTAEKAKAETVTRQIDGVMGVRNFLQVVARQHQKAKQESDGTLKQQSAKAVQVDPSLQDSHISVQSVNQGVVLLTGTAKTLSAHLRAVEVVAIIPGVQRVVSEVRSPNTLAEAEL